MLSTSEEVQIELEEMQPLLEQVQIETDESMEQIKKDIAIAKEVVQREEKKQILKVKRHKPLLMMHRETWMKHFQHWLVQFSLYTCTSMY